MKFIKPLVHSSLRSQSQEKFPRCSSRETGRESNAKYKYQSFMPLTAFTDCHEKFSFWCIKDTPLWLPRVFYEQVVFTSQSHIPLDSNTPLGLGKSKMNSKKKAQLAHLWEVSLASDQGQAKLGVVIWRDGLSWCCPSASHIFLFNPHSQPLRCLSLVALYKLGNWDIEMKQLAPRLRNLQKPLLWLQGPSYNIAIVYLPREARAH